MEVVRLGLVLVLFACHIGPAAAIWGTLSYDFDEFRTKFDPTLAVGYADKRRDPDHDDYDPFLSPLPKLKEGIDAAQAFEAIDLDKDGIVDGEEFQLLFEGDGFARHAACAFGPQTTVANTLAGLWDTEC
eukprot:SAG11_NODE_1118_length_5794_cov_8.276032_5_plen_130_part_00